MYMDTHYEEPNIVKSPTDLPKVWHALCEVDVL
jgi:hypothetical protein